MKTLANITAALLLTTTLSGCIPAIIGAGAAGGETAVEERTAGTKFDDNTIALKINGQFAGYSSDLGSAADVHVFEGRVLITGKVKFPELKDAATKLAWKVSGVKEVINELQVTEQGSIGRYSTDARISNQIRGKLLVTDGVHSSNYGLETVDGTVYLIGIAQDSKEQQNVIDICRTVTGVGNVVSYIILKDDPRRGDKATPITPGTNSANGAGNSGYNSDAPSGKELPE